MEKSAVLTIEFLLKLQRSELIQCAADVENQYQWKKKNLINM